MDMKAEEAFNQYLKKLLQGHTLPQFRREEIKAAFMAGWKQGHSKGYDQGALFGTGSGDSGFSMMGME